MSKMILVAQPNVFCKALWGFFYGIRISLNYTTDALVSTNIPLDSVEYNEQKIQKPPCANGEYTSAQTSHKIMLRLHVCFLSIFWAMMGRVSRVTSMLSWQLKFQGGDARQEGKYCSSNVFSAVFYQKGDVLTD